MRFKNHYYNFIGIIILIIIISKIDFQKMALYLSKINLLFFILINLLNLPILFMKSYRWRYILHLQKINYSPRMSFIMYLGGFYAGIVTPGRAGEAVKALYLKEDKNIAYSEGLASIFIDRFFDLYLLILFGWIGFFYFLTIDGVGYWAFSAFSLFLLLISFLLLNKTLLEKSAHMFYRLIIYKLDKSLFEGHFKIFFSAVKKMITLRLYPAFALSTLIYLLYFLHCYLLARLAHINISYMNIIFFISLTNLLSMLPITILGIGTREASIVYFFSLLSLSTEMALVYSFLLFLSFYVFSSIVAFIGWHSRNLSLKIK